MKSFFKRNKWPFFCGGMVWGTGLILLLYAILVGPDYMSYETIEAIEKHFFVGGIIIWIIARILFGPDTTITKD